MSIVPASAPLELPTPAVGWHYYILEKTDSKWYEEILTGVVDPGTWTILLPSEEQVVRSMSVEFQKDDVK